MGIVTAFATIFLIRATIRTGHHAADQAAATREATKESVWTNRESHFVRMMNEAQETNGARRNNALFALVEIAEEWGEGRQRQEIVRLFRAMAVHEEREHLASGGDNMGVSAFLEYWDRHGIGIGATTAPPIDRPQEHASLWRHLKWAYYHWRRGRRKPKRSVSTSDFRTAVRKANDIALQVDNTLRRSGHSVIATHDGFVDLRVGDLSHTWVKGEDVDWENVPKWIHRGKWSWIGSVNLGGRLELQISALGIYSNSVPNGEWQVRSRIVDNGITHALNDGVVTHPIIWKWRDDGPVWITDEDSAFTELRNACDASIQAYERKLAGLPQTP